MSILLNIHGTLVLSCSLWQLFYAFHLLYNRNLFASIYQSVLWLRRMEGRALDENFLHQANIKCCLPDQAWVLFCPEFLPHQPENAPEVGLPCPYHICHQRTAETAPSKLPNINWKMKRSECDLRIWKLLASWRNASCKQYFLSASFLSG